MKLAYLVTAVALLAPAVARADDAQEHVDRATRAYNVQDWPAALKEYRQAYEIDPKPETLWAIAQTQRLSGDCRGAILTYRAYLRGASAAGANQAEQWIKTYEATIDAQQKAADDATRSPPVTPPQQPPQPQQPASPPPSPQTPPPHVTSSPEHRSWILDPLGDTLAVVALAGFGGGGYFLLTGNSDMSAAAHKPTYQAYDKAVSDAQTEQHVGEIALIGGAVFAVVAVVRYHSVAARHPDERQAVVPVVVPGGALVTYGAWF